MFGRNPLLGWVKVAITSDLPRIEISSSSRSCKLLTVARNKVLLAKSCQS